jgi:flavin reductase (DIM6/NTAB) family NADH-FMN oxidoreductase RutF
MRKRSTQIEKFYYLYPQAVAFVGYADNIMPAAWHTPISAQPPLHGVLISPKRYTFKLLDQKKGFTINFLGKEHADISANTGSTSGRDLHKLETYDIKYEYGDRIKGPILTDAYAAYECEHYAVQELGDHYLFVGKIVLIHYDDSYLCKRGVVDPHKIKPMLYFGKDRYITIDPDTLAIKSYP